MYQKTDKQKLGICIPTYNRDNFLKILLESLLSQCKENGVQIFISDNCSNDKTEEVVIQFQRIYSNISYSKNDENIGFYRNLIKVLKMAQTEYVWMMDDDDIILNNAISKILHVLDGAPDFIVINSSDCTQEMQIKNYKIIKCNDNRIYYPGMHQQLLYDLRNNSYFGIMASMLAKKSILEDNLVEMENQSYEFYNNSYLPMILFYRSIVGKLGIFLCEPFILRRPNMRNSSDFAFNWFVGDRLLAITALLKYNYDLKNIQVSFGTKLFSSIFNATLIKCSDPHVNLFNNFIKNNYLVTFFEKAIYLLFDYIPLTILKMIRKILYKITGL